MTNFISEHISQEVTSDIKLLLRDLMKVIKVLAMYPPENPLPAKMRRSFGARFVEVVNELDGLAFAVFPDTITYGKEVVFTDKGTEEKLAGLFYDAGVSQIQFSGGLPAEELDKFLDLLKGYLNDRSLDRDLVSLLWQEQFGSIKYKTVEDLALGEYGTDMMIREMYPGLDAQAGGESQVDFNQIILDDAQIIERSADSDETPADGEAAAKPDPALQAGTIEELLSGSFLLAEEEKQEIARLIEENRNFDPYRTTTRVFLELLVLWEDLKPFSEAVAICEKLLDQFLAKGAFAVAADFVHSLKNRHAELGDGKPRHAERLEQFISRAGDFAHIQELTDIINRQETIDAGAVEMYLESLGWESLPHVTAMLGSLVSKNARFMVCDYLARRGGDHLNIIANGIRDKRWYVVRNTVMILGQIGGDQVLHYLATTASHPEHRVRVETMRALEKINSEKAIDLLTGFLADGDADLRVISLNYLAKIGGRRAFEAMRGTIQSDTFAGLPVDEQERYFVVYSRLGGSETTDYLASIIKSSGWFAGGRKIRLSLAALRALAYNKSEEAEKLILTYTRSRRQWLREAAMTALEQRRRIIYGGGDAGESDHE